MAYGSGTSLLDLSFTPTVAIMIGQYSSYVTGYYTRVAIKGYDSNSRLCTCASSSSINAEHAKCTFSTNSVTFEKYNENFRLYNYKAFIVAFGT